MAINTSMLASDLQFMISDLSCSLTAINGTALGTAISGTWGEVGFEQELQMLDQMSSDLQIRDRSATFVITDFTTVPSENDSLTIDSVIYFVKRREDDPSGVGVTFDLGRN